ncbi:unnamed protein product [Polarella glacialis]|uniref:Uncharacterized protein n=1 Tax=Polarella glacialis TaxID=89957 RepID=A0A813I483_POLGL|nr:unnamed protein product [Polarella glacialis]
MLLPVWISASPAKVPAQAPVQQPRARVQAPLQQPQQKQQQQEQQQRQQQKHQQEQPQQRQQQKQQLSSWQLLLLLLGINPSNKLLLVSRPSDNIFCHGRLCPLKSRLCI